MNHLLKLLDLSAEEIMEILNFADQLKYEQKHGIKHQYLEGKTLGMIFQKVSTRIRVSFEVGMYQLGGMSVFLSAHDLQIGRGEPIQDTARILSRYLDGLMIRTYAQQEVETLARYSSVPVINGLSDLAHPCQVLADLMTIREFKGKLDGLKLCFIGDGDNMMNSVIVGGLKTGMKVSVACPRNYRPDSQVLKFAENNSNFRIMEDPKEAIADADVVFTDVWVSMGKEAEAEERHRVFQSYRLDSELMKLAAPDAMVQHCLPARRGEEITEDLFEDHAEEIFEESENGLHIQKTILAKLLGGK